MLTNFETQKVAFIMNFSSKTIIALLLVSLLGTSCISSYYVESVSQPEYPNVQDYTFKGLRKINGLSSQKDIEVEVFEKEQSAVSEIEKEMISQNLYLENLHATLLTAAKSYLGTRYRLGGTSYSGIDCSAFVQNAFRQISIELPRVASAQAQQGYQVMMSELRVGDLLFFHTKGRYVSHVGIVERIENDVIYFIHSASSTGVTISSLSDNYWGRKFLYAKRVIQ